MSNHQPDEPSDYDPTRVIFRTDHSGGSLTLRPRQFLASAPEGDTAAIAAAVQQIRAEIAGEQIDRFSGEDVLEPTGRVRGSWLRFELADDTDIIRLVRGLRERGIPAQPNHVYFVNSLGMNADARFDPNMFAPNMFAPNMFAPNMFAPNMFAPNMFAGGTGGGGCCCPGALADSETRHIPGHAAREVKERTSRTIAPHQSVEIHIIDIGGPGSLRDSASDTGELIDASEAARDAVDENGDGLVDPAMGHGHFIRSIIRERCGLAARLWNAASSLGDLDDACLVTALQAVDADVDTRDSDSKRIKKVLNLSLSGYNEDDRPSVVLADQVKAMIAKGWLIVASAGNNASCRLAWPAALPDVVAVGAISKCAPAWFSNYGPWVDVSAPGVDVVAEFPRAEDIGAKYAETLLEPAGETTTESGPPSLATSFLTGWAKWSGTSFSAPFVTARLAAHLNASGNPDRDSARLEAIEHVVRDKDLDWLPHYGRLMSCCQSHDVCSECRPVADGS